MNYNCPINSSNVIGVKQANNVNDGLQQIVVQGQIEHRKLLFE